ncbi:MAG: 4-(cytidine 5'-diphospho)-2-C-methyl-D-erythritol kinase [Robiginitomaculum sp.]|nr:4-(cytidine 5'-diphospho)-2-C-methyl-D-erythritol kinase [Robiginitomaculum sp.]MDQ7077723.1 4-(cytidine 5'-diphospho)-2-C-methyl-D-erythritol kinase [Robiginitomaculum sp.]
MTFITEFARAKINLTLKVGPLGRDGYHPLESLVVFADAGDRLDFAPAPDLTLAITGPFGEGLDTGVDNLVLRAARALLKASGKRAGAHIILDKALPIASGIGGGSADAAAALRGLNRLWGCKLSYTELENIGQALGADVPVCVQSRTRFMSGRGEVLHDVKTWPVLDAVLVNPGFAVSTAAVFSHFDEMNHGETLSGESCTGAKDFDEAIVRLRGFENSLSAAACALEPRIASLLSALDAQPQTQLARLCGSGATCVALVRDACAARSLAQDLQKTYPQAWIKSVKLGLSPCV